MNFVVVKILKKLEQLGFNNLCTTLKKSIVQISLNFQINDNFKNLITILIYLLITYFVKIYMIYCSLNDMNKI